MFFGGGKEEPKGGTKDGGIGVGVGEEKVRGATAGRIFGVFEGDELLVLLDIIFRDRHLACREL